MRRLIFSIIFFQYFIVFGNINDEVPQVPSSIEIAGIKLKITDAAQRDIQKDVDALRASEKYFQVKLDRVNLYFPIIERVFREEGVPDDLKYLSVQESALISDIVSSSDAVGFWQFKDFTAREVGLRVDNRVDERKNIVSASRGAAKYLKRNNAFFSNWIYAVNAYMTGPGGAQRFVDRANFGKDRMIIDKNTHWYVKRFIAHYIAFKDEIGRPHSEGLKLVEYSKGANQDLDKIADQFGVDRDLVKDYNKWLGQNKVPDDKVYTVIIPVKGKIPQFAREPRVASNYRKDEPVHYPRVLTGEIINQKKLIVTINKLDAVIADKTDNIKSLARQTEVPEHKIEKYNDLRPGQVLKDGQVYYIESKRNRAKIFYHVTRYDESLWDISQKYGVKLKKLARKNRMEMSDAVKPGRLIWLRKNRPKNEPIAYYSIPPRKAPVRKEIIVKNEPPVNSSSKNTSPTLNTNTGSKNNYGGTNPPIPDKPLPKVTLFKYHPVNQGETISSISTFYGIPAAQIREWNEMSTTEDARPGQNLRLKTDKKIQPVPGMERIQKPPKDNQSVTKTYHTVTAGETLWGIARKYGVEVEELKTWNQLNGNDLSSGQQLIIKDRNTSTAKTESISTANKGNVHEVQPGESLWSISQKYGTTVEQILEWNDIEDHSQLKVGQELIVESNTTLRKEEEHVMFIVKPGDSLYKIASQFNMTVEEIMELNNLESTAISIGDELKVRRKK